MKNLFFILFLLMFSCSSQNKSENIESLKRKVNVDYGVQAFSNIQTENQYIIKKFEECYNTKSFFGYVKYWDKNDTIFFNEPFEDLYGILNRNYPAYKPTIISIQKINKEKYLVKIAVIGNPEGFFSIDYIYNIYAIKNEKNDFVFKNTISDNLKKWKIRTFNNISYYYPKNRILNEGNIQKQIGFENYLTEFLNMNKINYKYVVCENINEIYRVLGYDFVDSMYFTEQSGGLSFSYQDIFFSGNNSEYYPHEVVHIYVRKKFPKINPVLNEGLATYLGGSKGMLFKNHAKILYDYLINEKISISEYLFDNEKRHTIIDSNTSIMYSGGAFLCHLAMSKYGKKGLFELLGSGKTNEDLKKKIEEVFKISIGGFDEFFNKELGIFIDE